MNPNTSKSHKHWTVEFMLRVFNDVKHGDQEHQDWLQRKLEDWAPTLREETHDRYSRF